MGSMDDEKDLRVGTRLKTLLTDAGFDDIDTRMIPIPLSPWSNGMRSSPRVSQLRVDTAADPRMREIGMVNRENVRRMFPTLALYPFTQKLHMSLAEVQQLTSAAAQEADMPRLKAYFPV